MKKKPQTLGSEKPELKLKDYHHWNEQLTQAELWPRHKSSLNHRELQDKAFRLCCQFTHGKGTVVHDSAIETNSLKQISI